MNTCNVICGTLFSQQVCLCNWNVIWCTLGNAVGRQRTNAACTQPHDYHGHLKIVAFLANKVCTSSKVQEQHHVSECQLHQPSIKQSSWVPHHIWYHIGHCIVYNYATLAVIDLYLIDDGPDHSQFQIPTAPRCNMSAGPQQFTVRQDLGCIFTTWVWGVLVGRVVSWLRDAPTKATFREIWCSQCCQHNSQNEQGGQVASLGSRPHMLAICNEELRKHPEKRSQSKFWNFRLQCTARLSAPHLKTLSNRIWTTSAPHPNHIRATSEPHPSHFRNNCWSSRKEVSSLWDPY